MYIIYTVHVYNKNYMKNAQNAAAGYSEVAQIRLNAEHKNTRQLKFASHNATLIRNNSG